jgi:hypothetical protein
MTQCIVSHILTDVRDMSRTRLEVFYDDCLTKDEKLDELAAIQEDNMYRRQLEYFNKDKSNKKNECVFFYFKEICLGFYYNDPYVPLIKSDNLVIGLEKSYGVPVLMEYDRPDEIEFKQSRITPMALALAQAVAEEQELEQANRYNTYYIDNNEAELEEPRINLIAEESIMSK